MQKENEHKLIQLSEQNKKKMVGTVKLSDIYMDILSTLPDEDKQDLISKLVDSMKRIVKARVSQQDPFAGFSSDWGGDMPTEKYADMLRSESVGDTRPVSAW